MNRRILNFERFLLENQKISTLNEDVDINSIPKSELTQIIDTDMKTYLKRAMWNKSIEVFYGKGYKGNPTEDKRELIVGDWFESHDTITMGEFFQDAWDETDQFCDRVVEFVEKGEISDTWADIAEVVGWAGVAAGLVAGGIALGGIAIPSATILSGFTFWGVSAINVSAITGLAASVTSKFKDNQYKGLSPQIVNMAEMIENKETTIKNFKSAIEGYWSDFEADWGLDRWLPAVQGMPGWNNSSWAKAGAENIGYSFSYWISYYAYKFLETKFGASVALTIQEQNTKPAQTTEPKKSVETQPQPKPSSVPQTSTDTTPTTQPEEVSGVKGAMTQQEIVIDDEVLSNYDL